MFDHCAPFDVVSVYERWFNVNLYYLLRSVAAYDSNAVLRHATRRINSALGDTHQPFDQSKRCLMTDRTILWRQHNARCMFTSHSLWLQFTYFTLTTDIFMIVQFSSRSPDRRWVCHQSISCVSCNLAQSVGSNRIGARSKLSPCMRLEDSLFLTLARVMSFSTSFWNFDMDAVQRFHQINTAATLWGKMFEISTHQFKQPFKTGLSTAGQYGPKDKSGTSQPMASLANLERIIGGKEAASL